MVSIPVEIGKGWVDLSCSSASALHLRPPAPILSFAQRSRADRVATGSMRLLTYSDSDTQVEAGVDNEGSSEFKLAR